MADSNSVPEAPQETLALKVNHQQEILDFELDNEATVYDLALLFAESIQADVERVSFLITPKPGLLKHPFAERRLAEIITPKTKIKGIGTPTADVQKLNETAARAEARRTARADARREGRKIQNHSRPNRNMADFQRIQDEATYSFHAIEPLKYLPNPEKSRRFLERLANDPGIKASMRKHKFSVGLLTEMNPAEHTTHESRTLGLNRNAGEVIELRLRTDAYDGYRDYKVIRKTLCHELAHNVHSEHNRDFHNLMQLIEKEVQQNDYLHGGHKLGQDEFYDPEDEYDEDDADAGGWKGGEFVLGGGSDNQGLTRRDIMARAAMSRMQKQKEADEQLGKTGSGTSET